MIDCHVHLYPPEANRDPEGWAQARQERHWAVLCTRRRQDGRPVQGFPALAELLGAMDDAGIEKAVLLGWYWERPPTCEIQNRFYAACVRAHPDRLAACAVVHPGAGRPAMLEEMARARGEGLCGLGELSPHSQGYGCGDAAFGEALDLAGAWGWPVNFHVTDPLGRPYPGRVETPLEDFVALARGHPATTFILAHWGGLLPLRLTGTAIPENIRYDTAASPLLYPADDWAGMLAAADPAKVVFGSDYPLDLYPRLKGTAPLARFASEARRVLRGPAERPVAEENARTLFRWN